MDQALITDVVVEDKDNSVNLQVRYGDEVVEFILDGKSLFRADWEDNIKKLFRKAIDDWI